MRALTSGDPARIGGYELLGRLGSGGMGTVYLGRSATRSVAAVKAAHAQYAQDPEFRRRFAREVEAARRVSGRFTAAVLDADPDAAQPWLATEYVAGPSVTEAVAEGGPLPEPSLRALAAGMVAALEAIHAAGLTHRDLKPSNVLLAVDGPRVIDFGIARAGDHTRITATGTSPGTPGYMPPEQVRGDEVGPPADVYALGATLVYAATGHGPHGHGDPLALVYRTIEDEPRLDGVPDALRPVLARCLAKEADDRPGLDELRALFSVSGTLGSGGGPWLPERHTTLILRRRDGSTVPPVQPRRRTVLFGGAGALLAVGGGTAAFLLRPDDPSGPRAAGASGSPRTDGGPSPSGTPSPGTSRSPSPSPSRSPDAPSAAAEPVSDGALPALPALTSGQGFGERPTLATGTGPAPTALAVRTLVQGTGTAVAKGDRATCHYLLQTWDRTEVLDSSFARGEPFTAEIGTGQLIAGWDQALIGKRAGSRLEFAVPPALGYGSTGQGKIRGTDTLVFVVDVIAVAKAS
ncbi:FKBP-type peptidyl-prolyl cis-trans isomerase [Kitasatospora sp. NPDC096147]|uniref:protein kinase domain-containing protein n=1 Tax=Kitasatospora sp. NPDC096147 TaxID=3364093 RepID=UPI0037FB72F6